ncbi:hypothetical protein ACHQM5_019520 [Ranunculus cassubicifolius]
MEKENNSSFSLFSKSGTSKTMGKTIDREEEGEEEGLIVPFLHRDIMKNVLVRIPADLLHANFMFQCKEWFNVISEQKQSFAESNVVNSKPGIIFIDSKVMGFIEFDGMDFKARELNTFKSDLRIVSGSCGLVLVQKEQEEGVFILNPVTNQILRVPPCCDHQCLWHELVFVPSSKEYKLVSMFNIISANLAVYHIRSLSGSFYCYSALVNEIDFPMHLLEDCSLFWNERICVNGILYLNGGTKILSFDPCNMKEEVFLLPVPRPVRLIELGGSIAFVSSRESHKFPLVVWTLKDIDTGEWEKRFKIDPFPKPLSLGYFVWYHIVGSLNGGEVIVFAVEHKHQLLAYNLKTRQWKLTTLKPNYKGPSVRMCHRVHVNSLVWTP